VTGRKRASSKDRTRERLLEEAWSIIQAAKAAENYAVASATLERAARIAGLWAEKPAADPDGQPAAQVFTSEPLSEEQWQEKFAPKG
jgi:hypothetical protein